MENLHLEQPTGDLVYLGLLITEDIGVDTKG